VTYGSGPYCFKISGELHHIAGSLLPPEGVIPSYAQIYIHDPQEQLALQMGHNQNLNAAIMTELQAMLLSSHPYVPLYQHAFVTMRQKPPEEQEHVIVKLHLDKSTDGRCYNLPTADETAAIIPGNGSEERSDERDIILRLQGGGLK
jgi:hypothetical protein